MERSIAIRRFGAALAALSLLGLGPARASAELDLAADGALLGEYTSETGEVAGTRVDYRGLAADPRWLALLVGLEASKPSALVGDAEPYDAHALADQLDTSMRRFPADPPGSRRTGPISLSTISATTGRSTTGGAERRG